MSYHKRKNFVKSGDMKSISRTFFVFCIPKELGTISIGKASYLLKQATYIRYVLAELSKFVQISTETFSDSFLQRIL